MKNLIFSIIRIIVGTIIAIPLLLYPYLYFIQEKLLFIRQDLSHSVQNYSFVEEVQIKTHDNVTLHGWLVKSEPKAPLLIYFGGNAEEVSGHIMDYKQLAGWSLLLVNYRGYGLSTGSPSEKNLFNDAVLLYDTFANRSDVDSNKIVAFGRSLGTGVAVYLASQRNLQGVVLVSPYDSMKNLAQEYYPYVPVSLLLKHHFDSMSYASVIKAPMLTMIAELDQIITPKHSLRLVKAWGGTVQQKIIKNANHDDISLASQYWETVTYFLDSVLEKDQL
ncbi:acetylxylan esterase [Candidatus Halobeggiatoa sp. HSG11]|nr:acetylxylan esterase [Candidatus Halobeggiatoa sp. HSG11]